MAFVHSLWPCFGHRTAQKSYTTYTKKGGRDSIIFTSSQNQYPGSSEFTGEMMSCPQTGQVFISECSLRVLEHLDAMSSRQVHLYPQSKLREKKELQNTDTLTNFNKIQNQIHTLTSRLWVQAFLDQLPVWILKNKDTSFIKMILFLNRPGQFLIIVIFNL